jgi:hypothetical protein
MTLSVASLVVSTLAALAPQGSQDMGAVRTPDLVTRIGGDREVAIAVKEGMFRCGPSLIEAPLPEGYPEPTPPGAIDIKRYPSVRRAEWRAEGPTSTGMNIGFWPLFNHIQKRDIPMTSPVEMDYQGIWPDPAASVEPKAEGAWTMSFLYRIPSEGDLGVDDGIHIVDTPPMTVVSIGIRGPYGLRTAQRGLEELKRWADSQSEWAFDGPVRVFHYNGPSVPNRAKWSEVQVPVRKVERTPERTDA